MLAYCYENGLGLEKDLGLAKKTYELSAINGNERAKAILKVNFVLPPSLKHPLKTHEECVKEGDFKGSFYFQNKDYNNAFLFTFFAYSCGSNKSAYILGNLYEKGWVFFNYLC